MEKLKAPDSVKKNRKRLGRGPGSGTGKTSGKGHKGQNARKGGGVRPGFEGGQTPLYRRLPKRGFKNSMFKVEYNCINLGLLNKFTDCTKIDKIKLVELGLIKSEKVKVKILGDGEFSNKIEISADKFSKTALKKIEDAGGKAIVLS